MKTDTSPKRFPTSPEEWEALIANAPETAPDDPDCPGALPDSDDKVIVSRSLGDLKEKLAARRKRGAGRRPKKEQVAIRYSPDVLAAFRATGRGWQTRMDNALREWVETHAA
ncbi:hypothetical protein AGMMS50256_13740 [Betaproteobacteria bacterium]|nr:hypothetical protein AGMMS50256_13740 [Betaproteobacteria bacterium]